MPFSSADNERPYLSFLRIPRMGSKPRTNGLLIVSDRSPGIGMVEDLLEGRSGIIDFAKFPDHVGNIDVYPESWFRERVGLYHEHDVKCYPGGVTFEVAEVQGKSEQLFEALKEMGMDGVEISADVIEPLAPRRRAGLIRFAQEMGLLPFTEVGRKDPSGALDIQATIDEIQTDLEHGSVKVTLENSELVPLMRDAPEKVSEIVEAVGLEHLVFEVGPVGFPELPARLIRTFGPGVNFENIEFMELIAVDQMRRGMSRAVNYGYLSDPEDWPDLGP